MKKIEDFLDNKINSLSDVHPSCFLLLLTFLGIIVGITIFCIASQATNLP
jgi:hypothetical protein